MILGGGLALFLFWYTGFTITIWCTTPLSYYSLLIPVALYLLGTYALIYLSSLRYIIRRIKLRSYLQTEQDFAKSITDKRANLIAKFEAYRLEFDQNQN
jgi:hypothetical protein